MKLNLKNICIFAVLNAKQQKNIFIVSAFFCAYYSAFAVNIFGLSNSTFTDCSTIKYGNCCLATTEGDSLFYFNKFNFIRKMPNNNEVMNSVKYSNATCTPNSATTEQQLDYLIGNLIIWDDPEKFKETLETLYSCFIGSDLADDNEYRSDAWFHYLELQNFLTRLKEFNPRNKK